MILPAVSPSLLEKMLCQQQLRPHGSEIIETTSCCVNSGQLNGELFKQALCSSGANIDDMQTHGPEALPTLTPSASLVVQSTPNISPENIVSGPANGYYVGQIFWDIFQARYGHGGGAIVLMGIPMIAMFFAGMSTVTSNSR